MKMFLHYRGELQKFHFGVFWNILLLNWFWLLAYVMHIMVNMDNFSVNQLYTSGICDLLYQYKSNTNVILFWYSDFCLSRGHTAFKIFNIFLFISGYIWEVLSRHMKKCVEENEAWCFFGFFRVKGKLFFLGGSVHKQCKMVDISDPFFCAQISFLKLICL